MAAGHPHQRPDPDGGDHSTTRWVIGIGLLLVLLFYRWTAPQWQLVNASRQASDAAESLKYYRSMMADYYLSQGRCPEDGAEGVPDLSHIQNDTIAAISFPGGTSSSDPTALCDIVATMKSAPAVAAPLAGEQVRLTMLRNAVKVLWRCSSSVPGVTFSKFCP